jgi:serine/threonine protein kinase
VDGTEYRDANLRLVCLKSRYRNWAGRHHRVHGTTSRAEFARDVLMLTGHAADEWEAGVPEGEWRKRLPDTWSAVSGRDPFAFSHMAPGPEPEIEDARVFLENKYINDTFLEGSFRGTPCIVKKTSKAVWSVGNEYRLSCRMYAAAPDVVPCPLGRYYDCAARASAVITAKVAGPSLTELLARGVTDAQADGFAADIRALAEALKKEGILHRDLFTDNLLLDSDGHLKAIDWQLAIDRARYREDPWVARHWKFRYVVFGVNRELGLGVWNDFHALGKVLALLPQTAAVKDVSAWLAAEAPQMTFAAPPDRLTRFKLRLYAVSLRVQMLLHPRKRAQLARRWHTIMDHPA